MLRRRHIVICAAAAATVCAVTLATPASAQGLFEALFGGIRRALSGPPPSAAGYAPERDPATRFFDRLTGQPDAGRIAAAPSGSPSRGFCVRTCDGAYFPVQSRPGFSAAEACATFCPASATKIFSGGSIDHAVARDGSRYADLDNAFAYRQRVVAGCTCNGRPGGGLARIDAMTDPTLRPGDVVATGSGLLAYAGNKNKAAPFTPVDVARFNKAERDKLAQIKVSPVSEDEEDTTASIPAAFERDMRRTQAASQAGSQAKPVRDVLR